MWTENQIQQYLSAISVLRNHINEVQSRINEIHSSRASYNEIIRVSYTHKKKVSWGRIFKTGWVWKTETRYRNEIKFNSERFNKDLAETQAKKFQSEQKLDTLMNTIQNALCLMQSEINSLKSSSSNISSEISSMQNNVNSMKNQLSHMGCNYGNLSSIVVAQRNNLNNLIQKKNQTSNNVSQLQTQNRSIVYSINQKKLEINNLQNRISTDVETIQNLENHIKEKIKNITVLERSALVYEALTNNNEIRKKEIIKLLEQFDYSKEEVAKRAVKTTKISVFDYVLKKGIKFDNLVSKDMTLGLFIIKHSRFSQTHKKFLDKMIKSGQPLNITMFTAICNGDFDSLDILIQYNKDILKKFIEIDYGISIVEYAIAEGNVELLNYIAKTDKSCFTQKARNYESYLEMALNINNVNVIQALVEHLDMSSELLKIINLNNDKFIECVLKNVSFSDQEICIFLKYCCDNDKQYFAEKFAAKITNPKKAFFYLINENQLSAAIELASCKKEELRIYIDNLLESTEEGSHMQQQLLSVMSIFNSINELSEEEIHVNEIGDIYNQFDQVI